MEREQQIIDQKLQYENYYLYHCDDLLSHYTDMNSKSVAQQSGTILNHFNERQQECFHFSEAIDLFPKSPRNSVLKLLSNMTKRGLLMRIKEGIYYIIPFEQDVESFMPNWHLLAKYLVKDAQHYIGYYSALQIHNLITQPSLKEQIVVDKQIRPTKLIIKNIPFQFIYHNPTHFFGTKNMWIDNFNKVKCSDLEKTFVDCLFKPNYAGGIVEIARAIYMSRDKINFEKLLKYIEQFNSQAVIKRLGFLLEILEIENPILEKLQHKRTASYVILDTELPREGKRLSKWRVQLNLDVNTIKSAIYT